jgi:hypothetical protein
MLVGLWWRPTRSTRKSPSSELYSGLSHASFSPTRFLAILFSWQELVEGSRPPPYRKIRKNVYSRNLKKMIPFLYGRCDWCPPLLVSLMTLCTIHGVFLFLPGSVLALDEHKKCLEDCVNRIMCVECSPKQCDPLICQNQARISRLLRSLMVTCSACSDYVSGSMGTSILF